MNRIVGIVRHRTNDVTASSSSSACGSWLRAMLAVALVVPWVATLPTASAQVSIAPGAVPTGQSGVPYNAVFTASGGQGPYWFNNAVGRLPNVLTLSPTGTLSGTPQPATVPFEIWATDADGREAKISASITVIQYPLVLTPALPPGTSGQLYSGNIGVTGGAPPYTCTVTSGALPPGLSLSSNCNITGTPAGSGGYLFTVLATDGSGGTATQSFTLQIAAAVVPTLSSALLGMLGLILMLATGISLSRKRKRHLG